MHEKYEYERLPLTMLSAKHIISQVRASIDQGPYGIEVIAKYVLQSHEKNGGLPPEPENDLKRIVYTTLSGLYGSGKTNFVSGRGISDSTWFIARKGQRIFGRGKHWVYLYYFQADKRAAEARGKEIWECKIGETERNPEARVKAQTRGTPFAPQIVLLLRTDKHKALEDAIHGVLTVRGRHRPELQGKEWFDTSPEEVKSIYDFILEERTC